MISAKMSDRCLIVQDVVVGYAATAVLQGVSLTAEYGEVVAIRGANGSGKSTLLQAIAGVVPLAGGDILIGGCSVRAASVDHIARRFGLAYLRQEKRGIPDLTIMENLTLAAWRSRSRADAMRRANQLLQNDDFGRLQSLRASRVSSLSGGERLLLSLAIVETSAARLVLLDEPLAGADPVTCELASRIISRWAQDGRCMLVAEHGEFTTHQVRDVVLPGTQIARA